MFSTVRLAHYPEQRSMAKVFTAAFWDDVLFGDLIHPTRDQYPDDFDLYWLRRIRIHWWDRAHYFVVSTDTDDHGREVLVGVAHWARLGGEQRSIAYLLWWLDPRHIIVKPLVSAYVWLSSLLHPNRAADPSKELVIEQSYSFLAHVWTGSRTRSWYLEALAVHPDYQNRGHGRRLVAWGMEKAKKEGISMSVISSWGKEDFYRKCGFDKEDCGSAGQGDGNPLANVDGGLIFFRDA